MNHICPHCKKKTQQPDRRGGSFVLNCEHCKRPFQTNTTAIYARQRAQARRGRKGGAK
jgi:ribosomal protein L37AE/L43A